MPKLFGQDYSKKGLLQRIGNVSQVGGVKYVQFMDGSERGVDAIEFSTGTGFRFTSLITRGLDISSAEYCGQSLCWRSAVGDVHPAYFEPEGLGWLRTFFGGLVATCGATYAGAPCTDEGEELGLHGRFTSLPAREVAYGGYWEGNEYWMYARGKMREASLFGANIVVQREVRTRLGEDRFWIHDLVTNEGYKRTPHMYIYHCNVGFPVLDAGSRLISPTIEAVPRDEEAADGAAEFDTFPEPKRGYLEKCYYHCFKARRGGTVSTGLVNRKFNRGQGFGVYLRFNQKELPYFTEWKMMGRGEYVVGMEPANCKVEGRDVMRKEKTLKFLRPGETAEYHLEVGVLHNNREIRAFEKEWGRPG